jgi:hypothetical protein
MAMFNACFVVHVTATGQGIFTASAAVCIGDSGQQNGGEYKRAENAFHVARPSYLCLLI